MALGAIKKSRIYQSLHVRIRSSAESLACTGEVRGARLCEIEAKDKEFASCALSGASKLVDMKLFELIPMELVN